MAIPIKTKSGKSLGGKFVYWDQKGALRTHKSFRKMWDAQEKRHEEAMGHWKNESAYIEKVLEAARKGDVPERQLNEALRRTRASGELLKRTMKHEPYFMEYMGDMTEKQKAHAAHRLHKLKGGYSTAARHGKVLEMLLEKRGQRKPGS